MTNSQRDAVYQMLHGNTLPHDLQWAVEQAYTMLDDYRKDKEFAIPPDPTKVLQPIADAIIEEMKQ